VSQRGWPPTSMLDLAEQIRAGKTKQALVLDESDHERSHPQKPWGDIDPQAKDDDDQDDEAVDRQQEPSSPVEEKEPDPPPPAPRTYSLLLKITQLTQHYLSSSSTSLRASLLSLIKTTIPALAQHENSYLPLVNTLWPELVSRLQDDEPHTISGALQVISIMIEHAGTFMLSRIESLWPDIKSIHARLTRSTGRAASRTESTQSKQHAIAQNHASSVGYVDTTTRALWTALERLLITCVKHAGVDAYMFDDVLLMLSPVSRLDPADLQVLRSENPDAVWLAVVKEDARTLQIPQSTGNEMWHFAVSAH